MDLQSANFFIEQCILMHGNVVCHVLFDVIFVDTSFIFNLFSIFKYLH